MKSGVLGLLCFAVLCITLTLGLWPFHSPQNDVTWLNDANGLAFGTHGSVASFNVLKAVSSHEGEHGTVEIWVRPVRWRSSATLVALYRPEYGIQFALRQSLSDLEVSAEPRTAIGRRRVTNHFYADDALGPALRLKKSVFITVTCGKQGTKVYLDGVLATVKPQFHVDPKAFADRVILGDSPRQPDSFRGQIRGLAIFESELNSTQVLQHYNTWQEAGRPVIAKEDRNIALYLFDEHMGAIISSHTGIADRDLNIPGNYQVIDKIALEPFWKEFDFSRSYWSGNIKNIIGFVPFGFCFSAYFNLVGHTRKATLFTIVLGALVSLTIEILQAFLPTRDSGTTDIITNTIGTWIGVASFKFIARWITQEARTASVIGV